MEDILKMKVKIVINTRKEGQGSDNRSLLWEGELEIKDKTEYLTMISVLAEGQPQPICQIPFAIGIGHYLWIAGDDNYDSIGESFEQ
jgi:hypothetical protein